MYFYLMRNEDIYYKYYLTPEGEQKATSPLLLLLYIKQIKLLLNHAF